MGATPNPESKTQRAMRLVDGGMTPFAAARQVQLAPNVLYLAIAKRRKDPEPEVCPECGQKRKSLKKKPR